MGVTVSVYLPRGRVAELQSGLMFPRRLRARWAVIGSRAGSGRDELSLAQFHPNNNNRNPL